MSLRAIKKRESLVNSSNISSSSSPGASSSNNRSSLFKKSALASSNSVIVSKTKASADSSTAALPRVAANFSQHSQLNWEQHRRQHLGRLTHSAPELRVVPYISLHKKTHPRLRLVRIHSEGDFHSFEQAKTAASSANTGAHSAKGGAHLFGAKSEVCLQTISTHSYTEPVSSSQSKMIKGARSHRDLTQSSYQAQASPPSVRRMSESQSMPSQRSSAMSSSVMTLHSTSGNSVDPNAVLRVPIIGYEVMEERARFTVYKLRVENPQNNDCWLVLRRYTDFVRLNNKLKQAFPLLTLNLPRKKLFGDNFNSVFLDNRVQGLQMFVNSIMAKEELRRFKLVRDFFCLDEPPTYSESMEECRAIFEAQEETIAHLKLQISSKDDLILSLQQKLRDEMAEKEYLKETLRNTSLNCSRCSSANESTSLKS